MTNETQEWNIDQAKFQGYVKAKLEENTEDHKTITSILSKQNSRISETEKNILVLQTRSNSNGFWRSIVKLLTG